MVLRGQYSEILFYVLIQAFLGPHDLVLQALEERTIEMYIRTDEYGYIHQGISIVKILFFKVLKEHV